MSTDTEHVEEGAAASPSLLETWRDWYHLPLIGVVILFMFVTRVLSYGNFITDDGRPALNAVDSWYHWRTVEWTAENYPNTMPYEIWTGFPTGNYAGQFGTLFDQIIVTIAMIVGLGDPSSSTLYSVALLTVPAMAALVAIPVFYMGRRLGGTVGGLVSIAVLALAPGTFFYRSTVGQLQHHVAEVLFMALAVLSMMVALRVAEREQPIYELVADKDWDALREPAKYSALAGVALSLYLWVWPPGVVLVGIFAVFFTVQLCLDYVRGTSPDHLAFVGAISMAIPALFMLVMIEEVSLGSTTSFGLLQPIAAALVAFGCLFMAGLARVWNNRNIDRRYYPAAIGGLLLGAFVVMWLALPDLYDTFVGNLTGRLLPLDPSDTGLTVSEVQPPDDFNAHVFGEFGAAFYTMLAGLAFLVARPFLGREFRAEYTLVIIWSLFLISMTATQVRFSYYLVLAVAVVNAIFVADVVRFFDLDIRGGVDSLRQVETYQIIVLVLVAMLVFVPLLTPMAGGATAWQQGQHMGPHHEAMTWEESNHWLAENTPEPGNWGEDENADQLDYMGTYEYPEDGDYDYPAGSYGVMSWWDYGHLITTQGERMPHSNPFQQHADSSSAFLTAESEDRGELVLDTIAAGENPTDLTDEELETYAEEAGDEEMRYVMIDSAMASSKFNAISQWSGPDYGYYMTPPDHDTDEHLNVEDLQEDFDEAPFHETMLAQLYYDDADGMEHYRAVHESEETPPMLLGTTAEVYNSQVIDPQAEAAQDLEEMGYSDGDVIHIDDGELAPPGEGQPSMTMGPMTEAEITQIQQDPMNELVDLQAGVPVQTFERVDGATLSGEVDDEDELLGDNATATVDVDLETNADRTFTYTQEVDVDDDGSFELTVPYATDNELGVEDGYTDSDVMATGDYNVSVGEFGEDGYETQTEVPEEAVVHGETVTLEDFEQTELEEPAEEDDEVDDEQIDEDEMEDELEIDEDELEDEMADAEDDGDGAGEDPAE
ncbi:dolichyl-diphosphooligosaccharide--protein glycosyltransferase [Natronorubrum sediminis]|uniref:dolichyl-phosphooligosaccharide-protein glycotransferase n=1 Tax=Natronorubrum sediminis TaxID=640943 RepID=A0A1H6FYJ1_9EURY|nr:oligosaccharyl transferase, archaeosortase A system-associated [Natronorubrum sediminis]SEH15891.1 dolichyl-diphosphooligosaccharide--protein glycosyltransferase [Natronorubrum sediminis]